MKQRLHASSPFAFCLLPLASCLLPRLVAADPSDPSDPGLRLDLPGLAFRPIDAAFAVPEILGWDARRTAVSLGGIRVSSLLARAFDEPYFSVAASPSLRPSVRIGPDPASLDGDALAGSVALETSPPPVNPYRPFVLDASGRAGFRGDVGGPAGAAAAGFQAGTLRGTLALAGLAMGAVEGLSADAERVGEALTGSAVLDLGVDIGADDRIGMIARIDGASGLVRGPRRLSAGFLRLDGIENRVVAATWRRRAPDASAWALFRSADRSLLAFDPARDRWSRSDENLWAIAAGGRADIAGRWWTFGAAGELRAEGVGSSVGRGFVRGPGSHADLLGDWPLRPAPDGASRAGGTVSVAAGIGDADGPGGPRGGTWDARAAISLAAFRLLVPEDPYGQIGPEAYGATERWEVEPAATLEGAWRLGDGLEVRARAGTGARSPAIEEIAPAGVDPAADVRWIPNYGLQPERSWGGLASLRLALGLVDLHVAYHAAWISGAIVAVADAAADDLPAAWRNTGEFVQGAVVAGSVYLHRDLRLRVAFESSHGWAEDGAGGEHRPAEAAPVSVLGEFAYLPASGRLAAGVGGGYRWRPAGWDLSGPDARLLDACVVSRVECRRRLDAPLGVFLRWAIAEHVGLELRADDLAARGDGPSVQGFLVGRY